MKNNHLFKASQSSYSGQKSSKKQTKYQESQLNSQYQRGFSASGRKSGRTNNNQKSSIKQPNSSKKGSITLKNKLIDFLVKAAEIQRKLEIIKQTLCEKQSFTPGSLFHRIDKDRKGYLLQKDVHRFLVENKIEFKGSELKILYGKMNVQQQDSGVMLWQFQNFILPNQNPRLRYSTMRRPVYIPLPEEPLQAETEWLLSKLLLEIMKQEAKLKEINATLISTYDFNPQTVFNFLASIQGFITGESLNNFLVNENCEISIQEVGCLIKLIDKQGQGRICFQDLKFFLATLRLKKEHQIFDQLSPIPALKNFVIPTVQNILGIQGSLRQRVADNKMHRQSPNKIGINVSGKNRRSRAK